MIINDTDQMVIGIVCTYHLKRLLAVYKGGWQGSFLLV